MRIVDLLKKGIPLNDSNKSKGTGFNWKPMPFFISCFAVKTSTNYSTNKLQVQKYVRLSHEFRAYIFVTFIGGIDPFCEPAAGDEIVYL